MKKRTSFILAMLMVVATITPALALEMMQPSEIEVVANQYGEMIPVLLYGEDFGVTEENCDDLYVGNPITSYVIEEGEIVDEYLEYPLMYSMMGETEIIGLGRVIEYENGEKTIDYGVGCAPELQAYIEASNNTPIALFVSEEQVAVKSVRGMAVLDICEAVDQMQMTNTEMLDVNTMEIEYALVEPQIKIQQPVSTMAVNAVEHGSLDVEYVPQVNNYGQPEGICWAACVASIINYHFDLGYSASDVAVDAVSYGYSDSVYSGLAYPEIKLVYDIYGGTNTYSTSNLTYSVLKSNINNDAPFHLGGYRTSGNNEYWHACVVYGYYYAGSGSKYMYYFEPNADIRRTSAFPSSGGIQFSSPSYTYTSEGYIICRS